MDTLEIVRPDDWHLHLRDGAALRAVVAASAAQFGRAIIMPNLKPPVVSVEAARAYRERILDALRASAAQQTDFTPLMTLYLTDATPVEEIDRAVDSGFVHGVKLYPAGATTNSDAGVTAIDRVMPVLERMAERGLPLLVHGEVTDPDVDLFDREAVFIDRVLEPVRRSLPGLRVVFEHITTAQAVDYVRQGGMTGSPAGRTAERPTLAATITAHHLLYNRNAIFQGGIRPHWYCLPVLKRETHRRALLDAATSGDARFFLGTDSAPHPRRLKEHASACAGCYTAPHAIELYATAFHSVGALDRLEGFASRFGAEFYGLPINSRRVRLKRERWQIPETMPFGADTIVPLAGGEWLDWRLDGHLDGRLDGRLDGHVDGRLDSAA